LWAIGVTSFSAVRCWQISPLLFEAGCAAVIAVTTASPFGDPERATGRRLPLLWLLWLGTTAALTAAAAGALAAAGAGAHLAWVGPTAYLLVGTYALGMAVITLRGARESARD
jgi:hypothetical protein